MPEVTLTDRRVAPSILSADFGRLRSQISEVLDAGARVIHVDVMDGHFVPPITFGPLMVSAIADAVHDAGGLIDVHLMIESPERQLQPVATAGADSITIHAEATPHVHYALQSIRELGCRASVALNPGTPAEMVHDAAVDHALDMVLCMSVNPGWGGQSFIGGSLAKLGQLRAMLADEVALEVDGGVNEQTVASVVDSGANLLVAGSAVFGSDDPAATYVALAEAAGAIV